MVRKSKRLYRASADLDRSRFYELTEAVEIIRNQRKLKFDETVEIAVALGVDPRHADQVVRGVINLPHGTGKKVRVAVFATGEKAKEAELAGADLLGTEDLAERIQNGEIDFERCIATPDMMGLVGKLGKILGPRGLMPNPKLGTVTTDIGLAVSNAKAGQVQFRAEKSGIVHAGVGKVSFTTQALIENINTFYETIVKAKPPGSKRTYIRKISLSSTMGLGIKVNLSSLSDQTK